MTVGKLNCLISARIFELLIKNQIPTHFLELKNENSMIAKNKYNTFRNCSEKYSLWFLCKQTTIKSGTVLEKPLIDFYLKNDELNDPLITKDRIHIMGIISAEDLDFIVDLTLKINLILKSFFKKYKITTCRFQVRVWV